MKTILTILFLSFGIFSSNAQNSKTDSLKSLLTGNRDEKELETLTELSKAFHHISYPECARYAREALNLSIALGDKEAERFANHYLASAHYRMGNLDTALVLYNERFSLLDADDSSKIAFNYKSIGAVFMKQGKLDQAKKYLDTCLHVAQEIDDTDLIIIALSELVLYYNARGDYVKAIKYSLEALALAEKDQMYFSQAKISVNLGMAYGELEDYSNALKYNIKARDIFEKINVPEGIALAQGNIALAYESMDMLDSAIVHYDQALERYRKIRSGDGILPVLLNIGDLQRKAGYYQEALKYYNEAMVIIDSAGLIKLKPPLLRNLARLMTDTKQYDKADDYYLQSLNIAQREGYKDDIRHSYLGLAELNKETRNLTKAYDYLLLHNEIKDSIINEANQEAIAEMQTRYETEKKEQEIALLTRENEIKELQIEKSRTRILLLTGGIIFIIIVAILLFISNRLRQKNLRTQLEKKNLETEQRLLRSQMNPHFIFNSMNSVQSCISDNDTLSAMTYLSKFGQLVRNILENSRKSWVPLEDEISTLKLYTDLEKMRFHDQFEYSFKISKDIDPEEVFIPPMLIQPLVENAIKHGLAKLGKKGRLELSIERNNGSLKCRVKDNGIGREEASTRKKSDHHSLGVEVINERLQFLKEQTGSHADMMIMDLKDDTGGSMGTLVELTIPYQND